MGTSATSNASTSELGRLTNVLKSAFRAWGADPAPWPDDRVDELARQTFRLQYEANQPYKRYCDRLGVTPADVQGWRDAPAVPVAAFREIPLIVGALSDAALEFHTSGTAAGIESRGRHWIRDPGLYEAALEPVFGRFVMGLPGGAIERIRMGSFIPSRAEQPHSSLAFMVDAVLRRFGEDGSAYLINANGIDGPAATAFLTEACGDGAPVCLLGTTLAFDAWTRQLEAEQRQFAIPAGSRVMDTGGAKGRRDLSREQVVRRLRDRLGVPADFVVNEFGMTELLSQRYDGPVAEGAHHGDYTLHGPPWLRSRALDPNTLAELPEGEVGVIAHFDLANAGSVCSVLTEDLGAVKDGVLRWVGRATGAPPRGCSLATAELLRAQDR